MLLKIVRHLWAQPISLQGMEISVTFLNLTFTVTYLNENTSAFWLRIIWIEVGIFLEEQCLVRAFFQGM